MQQRCIPQTDVRAEWDRGRCWWHTQEKRILLRWMPPSQGEVRWGPALLCTLFLSQGRVHI